MQSWCMQQCLPGTYLCSLLREEHMDGHAGWQGPCCRHQECPSDSGCKLTHPSPWTGKYPLFGEFCPSTETLHRLRNGWPGILWINILKQKISVKSAAVYLDEYALPSFFFLVRNWKCRGMERKKKIACLFGLSKVKNVILFWSCNRKLHII